MWLDEDTAAALEWIDYEASLCSGCGHPRAESFDPKNAFEYDAEPLQCHACKARDERAAARNKKPNTDHAGIYYAITKRQEA